MTREFFQRLPYDLAKQFAVLNGFITPAMEKKGKAEATGDDNAREHS